MSQRSRTTIRPQLDTLAVRVLAHLGLAAFVVIVVAEHVVDPSLDPASHEISEYVHGPAGQLMTIGFLAWSISLAAGAVLAGTLRPHAAIRVALLAGSAGLLLTACFATQTSAGRLPPGVALNTAGRLHDIGSGVTTVALLLAAAISLRIRGPATRSLRRMTVAVLVVILPSALVLLAFGNDVGGVRQRLLVLGACAWQLAFISATRRCRASASRRTS